ncbi:VRR-NUC domain-containing protein [Propionimicrobium lymphophilum]|uniref:VRR-NUC domain-containing protein n=1 Tax=Propionimicrobium lymphophilum TaxID=33012 RepID=UPI003EC94E72
MKEKYLEQALKTAIENLGGICWKLVSPGTTGVPDRICLKAGRVVFVEVKAPGKKPRPIQKHRMAQLREQGFTVLVVDSPDGIAEVSDALQAA